MHALLRRAMLALCLAGLGGGISAQGQAFHSSDSTPPDYRLSISEVMRGIQFYNSGGFHCDLLGEDGYAPRAGELGCAPHDADYAPRDWSLSLEEVLRLVQFFNSSGYHLQCGTEDGFAPGPAENLPCAEGEGEDGLPCQGGEFGPPFQTSEQLYEYVAPFTEPVDGVGFAGDTRFSRVDPSNKLYAVLYADNGGRPGQWIATARASADAISGYFEAYFDAPLSLPGGGWLDVEDDRDHGSAMYWFGSAEGDGKHARHYDGTFSLVPGDLSFCMIPSRGAGVMPDACGTASAYAAPPPAQFRGDDFNPSPANSSWFISRGGAVSKLTWWGIVPPPEPGAAPPTNVFEIKFLYEEFYDDVDGGYSYTFFAGGQTVTAARFETGQSVSRYGQQDLPVYRYEAVLSPPIPNPQPYYTSSESLTNYVSLGNPNFSWAGSGRRSPCCSDYYYGSKSLCVEEVTVEAG